MSSAVEPSAAGSRVEPAPAGPAESHLVGLDIDGTLLTHDGVLSADVQHAAAAAQASGHHVVLASGRSLTAMTPVAELLGITSGWMVCSNGAVTVRLDPALPRGWELDQVRTFDPEPALRLLRDELPGARFAVEDIGVGFRLNALFPDGELDGEHQVVDFDQLWAREVTRVIVRSPEHTPDQFSAMAARIGLDDVTYAVGWTAWMDVAPRGVTKASALERLRERLGVDPGATVAVGDGHNDVDMLRWAARGVAMGHADDVVRGAADEVTGSIDEDGAVAVLRSLP
ncbi:HAD family hydrolase [Isoptericola cucumis]|uniref:Haloacid dehalogenase n=1 Tax=Isoptericola cucumis TaxID=1776856 RepID=A0ABQ2B9T1_9MICO|nr:HAD family hydrolase [Isoptericola cucumis]GGI11169.1 haloacid dehalogenase [Isoptericola cucumis]